MYIACQNKQFCECITFYKIIYSLAHVLTVCNEVITQYEGPTKSQ